MKKKTEPGLMKAYVDETSTTEKSKVKFVRKPWSIKDFVKKTFIPNL